MIENIQYRREMNRNYMVIRSEWNDQYTVRMLSGNKILGLLQFQEKCLDGKPWFYYDITSKQPLNRLTDHKKMTGSEIRTLISDLIFVLRQMERFLLDERRICLKSEYIYIESDTYHGSFCLIPGYYTDFIKEFQEFAQYILDHTDHNDSEAVVLAFSVFRESRKENFGIDDIERCLGIRSTFTEIVEVTQPKCEPACLTDCTELMETVCEYPIDSKENFDGRSNWIILEVLVIGVMAGLPICVTLLFGLQFLLRWKWLVFMVEMLFATIGIIIFYCSTVRKGHEEGKEDTYEEALKGFVWDSELEMELSKQPVTSIESKVEEDMQTVLLISQEELSLKRKLITLSDKKEISLDYFPFLIGKNKGLVDFCLSDPRVSRLHAKIEKDDTEYFLTDLNSTNGTKINGFLLEANEKKQIQIGDELEFAGILFRFQ